jgi:hypothetical protein
MPDFSSFDDADLTDPLTELRIPVTGAHPYRGYLAAFAGNAEPFLRWPRPDDAEAAALASYIGYLRARYPEHVQRRMLEQPLDTGDLAALVFAKRGEGDWAYRRAHWTEGAFWWPLPEGCEEGLRLPLVQVLDHVETNGGATQAPEWEAWKAARPDVFKEAPDA